MKTDIRYWSYLAQFFLEWEMFQTKVVEKIKTHILCSVTLFQKSYRLWDNVEKYYRAGQVTDDNTAHAHYVLSTYSYAHTQNITLIAFPLQQWLHEHISLLHYTYIANLVSAKLLIPLCVETIYWNLFGKIFIYVIHNN